MNTTDLATNNVYRAYLAYFLYQHGTATPDHRISHQLLNHATAVQQGHGMADAQASPIIDQAHAASKAETSK